MTDDVSPWHLSRGWEQDPFAPECGCEVAECGHVRADKTNPDCPQHSVYAMQTIRSAHRERFCPATREQRSAERRAVSQTNLDWCAMFIRYAQTVGEMEGVDFLADGDWTQEEWDAIWDAHLLMDGTSSAEWIERARNNPRFSPKDEAADQVVPSKLSIAAQERLRSPDGPKFKANPDDLFPRSD